MKNILTLVLLSICYFACAQKKQAKTNQANIDAIQEQKNYIKQTIAFIEIVNQNKPLSLSDNVDKNDFTSCLEELKQDTLTFTRSELDYIVRQSKNPPIKKWTKELVPVAKLINGDTINEIFKDNKKWWPYFYKKIGRDFNSFSAPIFVKNNQYCIFYSGMHCGGLCGGGELTLYKREGYIWKKVKSYCNWIS